MEFLVTLSMRFRIAISNISMALIPVALSGPGALWAAPEDTVQAYVSTSITHDDNLLRLRLSDTLGQPSADTIKQSTLGVKVDWKQGRQGVILDASINESRFSRFASLNYRGINFQSRWKWQLGNSLGGDIGYNRNTSLGSFTEQQGLVSNLSTQQNEFAGGEWQIEPGLRLSGTLTRAAYSVAGNPVYGNESTSYAVGAYFTPPGGNTTGVRGVRQVQKYSVLEAFSGVPVDNGFTQDQLLATVNWLYSGHIRVNGQAGVVSRVHNQLPERDFSGATMRGALTWFASGKSQFDLTMWNEINGYDNLTTSFTQSKGVSFGPAWRPTSKLGVSAQLQHLKRDFLGNPLLKLFPGMLAPIRQDTVSLTSLSVNYQPMRTVNMSASIQTERRSSNQPSFDYADKTINLNMSFGL